MIDVYIFQNSFKGYRHFECLTVLTFFFSKCKPNLLSDVIHIRTDFNQNQYISTEDAIHTNEDVEYCCKYFFYLGFAHLV